MPVRAPKLYTLNALSDQLHHDRRSLKLWLANVRPDGHRDGNPLFKLATVQAVISKRVEKRKVAATAREKLTLAQTEQILTRIKIMKRDWLPVEDVSKWGGELAGAIRKVVTQLHLLAPNIVGLSVPDAEALLKDKEDEILEQLHLIDEQIKAASNESENESPGQRLLREVQAEAESEPAN